MEKLIQYDWPGNVRELENFIELVVNTEVIPDIYEIGIGKKPDINIAEKPEDLTSNNQLCSLKDAEREHILKVLNSNSGNITHAAQILGIGRNTLYRKLKEFGIDC